jgi:hypothetical protein
MKNPPRFVEKNLIAMLRDFSRKAKPPPATAALPGFQVQSLANREEQRGIMTRVATIGVVGGLKRAAINASSSLCVAGTSFEGGA